MPTVLREGPYRIYFFSHEPNEPAHVHVDRDASSAKFWLNPVGLARNLGFRAADLREIDYSRKTDSTFGGVEWVFWHWPRMSGLRT
jgi:hypothetical protein